MLVKLHLLVFVHTGFSSLGSFFRFHSELWLLLRGRPSNGWIRVFRPAQVGFFCLPLTCRPTIYGLMHTHYCELAVCNGDSINFLSKQSENKMHGVWRCDITAQSFINLCIIVPTVGDRSRVPNPYLTTLWSLTSAPHIFVYHRLSAVLRLDKWRPLDGGT